MNIYSKETYKDKRGNDMTKEELEYNRGYRYGYERGELNGYKLRKSEEKHCEDAVSRQAVLAIAGDSCLDLDSYKDTEVFCYEIKSLPPVTPMQKTGYWFKDPKVTEK